MPASRATLSVHDVDEFLDRMTGLTKEDEQRLKVRASVKPAWDSIQLNFNRMFSKVFNRVQDTL